MSRIKWIIPITIIVSQPGLAQPDFSNLPQTSVGSATVVTAPEGTDIQITEAAAKTLFETLKAKGAQSETLRNTEKLKLGNFSCSKSITGQYSCLMNLNSCIGTQVSDNQKKYKLNRGIHEGLDHATKGEKEATR